MASKIVGVISPRNFELIRDRIAAILADELFQQFLMDYEDSFELPDIWIDRVIPFDSKSQFPAVNVGLAKGTWILESQISQTGTWQYFIDVYVGAKSSDNLPGDQKAAQKLHRLMGIIQAILMDHRYVTLDFDTPGIYNRSFADVDIADPEQSMNKFNAILARLQFNVTVSDDVEFATGIPLADFTASVKLSDTSKGYVYAGASIFGPEPECPPGTLTVNNNFFDDIPSGETLNIILIDTNGNAVGAIYDDQIIVPASGGDPVGTTMNGAVLVDTPDGEDKAFTIRRADDSAVVVTTIEDTANSFIGEVPDILSGISTQVGTTGQENASVTGDDGDRFLNGDYASKQVADLTDVYTLVLANPDFPNHNKRLTGDTGGYQDEPTGNFFDKDNVATTKALAFPNDIMRDYAWRRRWFLLRSGARTWTNAVALAQTDVRGGEGNWFLPNKFEYEMLSSNSTDSPTHIDSRLFNWSLLNMWSSTTDKNLTASAYRFGANQDVWLVQPKTQTNAGAYVKLF